MLGVLGNLPFILFMRDISYLLYEKNSISPLIMSHYHVFLCFLLMVTFLCHVLRATSYCRMLFAPWSSYSIKYGSVFLALNVD